MEYPGHPSDCQPHWWSRVDGWLDALLPRRCLCCGVAGVDGAVCAGCEADLPWLAGACVRCGEPLRPGPGPGCCLSCPRPLRRWVQAWSPLAYEYPVDRLVQAAKFGRDLALAFRLGELMAQHLTGGPAMPTGPTALLPVPLHRDRHARRGFNQAGQLALALSRATGWPVLSGACSRLRATPEQSGLGGRERRRNLRGAFAVTRAIRAAHVIVIDDVLTTGATSGELGRTLAAAGVARCSLWTLARVVRQPAARKV